MQERWQSPVHVYHTPRFACHGLSNLNSILGIAPASINAIAKQSTSIKHSSSRVFYSSREQKERRESTGRRRAGEMLYYKLLSVLQLQVQPRRYSHPHSQSYLCDCIGPCRDVVLKDWLALAPHVDKHQLASGVVRPVDIRWITANTIEMSRSKTMIL